MKAPSWFPQISWGKDRPGAYLTLEVEVKNMADVKRLVKLVEKLADDGERLAISSDRIAAAWERMGIRIEHDD